MTYAMAYLIILLVCLAVFYRSLKYGIVVDDIANRKKAHKYPSGEMRRPLWRRVVRRLNGEHPVHNIVLDHAITLGIHTLVCMLMYRVFGSLPAAILFAVNVGNNQVSLWLNGKRYAVNAVLCLLALLTMPWGIGLWALTGIFQASAVTFPLIMMLAGSWWLSLAIPLFFLVGDKHMIKWLRSKASACKKNNTQGYVEWNWRKVFFMLKTIAWYFLRGIVPYTPTFYPERFKNFDLTKSGTEESLRFDWGVVAGLAIVALTVVGYLTFPYVFFGMVWWLITIAVFSNAITLTVPLAERYLYLPNIGLMVTFCHLLNLVHPMAWILVAVWYASRIYVFMPMYQDIDQFLRHHTHFYPESDQCWIFRANRHASNGDIFGVMHLSNAGLLSNPKSSWLWLHRANGFVKLAAWKPAEECLEKASAVAEDKQKDMIKDKLNEITSLKEAVKCRNS